MREGVRHNPTNRLDQPLYWSGCITPHAYASTTDCDKSRRARERVVVVYGSLADTVATDVLGNTNVQCPTTKHASIQ